MRKNTLCVFCTALYAVLHFAVVPARAAEDEAIQNTIDQMLDHVGGREVWAQATGFHVVKIERVDTQRFPVIADYWRDFEKKNGMMHVRNHDFNLVRAYSETQGVVSRDGQAASMSADELSTEHDRWAANIYLIFALLARNDDMIVSKKAGERLIITDDSGNEIFWIGLDADNRPAQYGYAGRDYGRSHILRNYENFGDVNLWTVTEPMQGGGRFEDVSFELFTHSMPYGFNVLDDLID